MHSRTSALVRSRTECGRLTGSEKESNICCSQWNPCLEGERESVDDGAEYLEELAHTVKMLRLVHESIGGGKSHNGPISTPGGLHKFILNDVELKKMTWTTLKAFY